MAHIGLFFIAKAYNPFYGLACSFYWKFIQNWLFFSNVTVHISQQHNNKLSTEKHNQILWIFITSVEERQKTVCWKKRDVSFIIFIISCTLSILLFSNIIIFHLNDVRLIWKSNHLKIIVFDELWKWNFERISLHFLYPLYRCYFYIVLLFSYIPYYMTLLYQHH